MQCPPPDGPSGQGDVHAFRGQALVLDGCVDLSGASGQSTLDRLADLVRDGADTRPVIGRQRTDATQDGR